MQLIKKHWIISFLAETLMVGPALPSSVERPWLGGKAHGTEMKEAICTLPLFQLPLLLQPNQEI